MLNKPLFRRSEGLLYLSLFLVLVLFVGRATAQTITISPKTGNVIAAVSTQNENHMAGYGGAWVHNQLPLNMFTSDNADLTDAGLPQTHANNIAPKGDKFVWCGGQSKDGFFTLSLPKGYRFTGYKLVITNNVNSNDFTESFGTGAYSMTERSGSFDGTVMATVNLGTHNTNNTTEYVLQRTATLANDMGNVLYFRLGHTSGQYAAVYVQSFVISFACDKNFVETVSPTADITTGVDCVAVPFETDRMDMGSITWEGGTSTGSSNKAWRYQYTNMKDLPANLLLYNDDGVKDGTAGTSNKVNGNIKSASDGMHFALQNDVYYIETPTEGTTQGNGTIPVGYRITGAKLHYANAIVEELALGKSFYITDGNGKYLNTSLKFTDTKVLWSSTTAGKIYNGSTYLKVQSSGGWPFGSTSYTLATTNRQNDASTFVLDTRTLYYKTTGWSSANYYIMADGTLATSGTKATLATESEINPAASSYTLKLYGTDGDMPAQTTMVNADNASGELEVALLNNDALKFEVSDLTDGSVAYVYAELTMEALNPYISKTDVVGMVADGSETISQSYLADDFTIGDEGHVNFHIPDNFASKKIKFSFDNLTNKHADNTYGPLAGDGYSRYHYVKSEYYDTIGENLQDHRTEAANSEYQKKVKTTVAGNQMFQVNNSDKFKVGDTNSSNLSTADNTSTTFHYEETRYTNSAYEQQGGKWEEVSLGKDDESKACYLVTCDEPRYNLAPTTTPRHAFYAYYSTNIKLAVQDYEPALEYVKVYDNAMLQTGFDSNAYYGVKVGAKMKDSNDAVADGEGYLFAKQIADQISSDAGKDGCPKDGSHVLYVDASNLNAVLYGTTEANKLTYGTLEALQQGIGTNAMIYLPIGTTYTLNNVASKATGGDFKAENNIILIDRIPFFAPHDIYVDTKQYTEYTRKVTHNYGKEDYVTLVLPFTIDIYEDGLHANAQGGSSFRFYNMQANNSFSGDKKKPGHNYNDDNDGSFTAHFTPVTGSFTESNKPYVVKVEKFESETTDNDVTFIVRQNGASIKATPTENSSLISGHPVSGKLGNDDMSFTLQGSFNGRKIDSTQKTVFYYAKGSFLSSANLTGSDKNVYMLPFRAYYDYTGTRNNAKSMDISLDPNESEATAISDIAVKESDLHISTAFGQLTVTASTDTIVSVYALSGQSVACLNLVAGQTEKVSLPHGIYLVNGQKVLVK